MAAKKANAKEIIENQINRYGNNFDKETIHQITHLSNEAIDELINNIMKSSPRFIILEPVINLSSRRDFLGYLARKSANVGHGDELFRFNENSLRQSLNEISNGKWQISFKVIGKDMIVDILRS